MNASLKIGAVAISCAILQEAILGRAASEKLMAVVLPVASEPQSAVVSGRMKTLIPLAPEDAKDLARPRILKLVLRPIIVEPTESLLIRAQLSESEPGVDVVINGELDITAAGAAIFKPLRVGKDEIFFITLDPWKKISPPKSLAIYVIPAFETPLAIKSEFVILSIILLP